MTYITQFDPRGSIPSSLVKAVQTQTPMCVAKVADYLTKYAPPPSISRTTLGRSNETFDAAKAIWSATFTSDATSAGQMRGAEVLLGRCTWSKTGYEITSNPANAELHRVEDGFRLILRDAGSVDIKIEKSTGKKATGTVLLNGKPFGTSQPAATTANQTTASTTTATPANVVSSATPRSIVKSSGTVNNMASVNSVNSSTSSNAMLRPRASAAVHTSQSSVGSIETRKSVGFSTATTVTAASLLPDPQLTSATTPVDSFFNDTTNISGILLTRKTRSETIPSMPVRVIRWQRLTDGQVAFVAFVAFLAFYLGLLYERYFIGGFLAWMQSE
ncbi:hypothetical protein BDF19DRAFT_426193 [Syncephalis fuscata]|nr:hypothetical protein BDF19DRAFT_426193 [Syncephalis fuscata]